MKLILASLALSLMSSSITADEIRNTRKNPLDKYEKAALRAAQSLARELGENVRASCVNASLNPGTIPVHVQFYKAPEKETPYCVAPHYSIMVKFDQETGKITGMDVLDN